MSLAGEPDRMPELLRQLLHERSQDALGEIVSLSHRRLRALARIALRRRGVPEAEYDADDALNSAMNVFLRLVLAGRLEALEDADGFWRLYRRILALKVNDAVDRHRAVKRGGSRTTERSAAAEGKTGHSYGASMSVPPDDLDLFQSGLPSAEVEAVAKETTACLISLLRPELQKVVRMRVDGRSVRDIAAELGVATRTVERMLERVRAVWVSSGLVGEIAPPSGRRISERRQSP